MEPTLAILAIGLPWLGAGLLAFSNDQYPQRQHGLATLFGVVTGLLSLGLPLIASPETVLSIPLGAAFGDFTLVIDGLAAFLSVVASVIGCLAIVFSIDYMQGEAELGRYYALVLLFIGAMSGLVLSGSLLMMFIFWEITALCSYALISFHNDDPKAVAGGVKALIVTQVGGVGLLAGALVAYASLGSYEISVFLAQAEELAPALLAVMAFGFLAAAAAKSAQVPFHTWLPDAMEAPTPISALIHAATMVNAGVYLLARFYPAFEGVPGWRLAVVSVGMLSALFAAYLALRAEDLKRILAYSTISQLGYMIYAIGTGGVFASQYHLLSHSVFKALLFLGAGAVIHAVDTRDINKMGGLGRQMPFVRLVFVIGALALAGVPLTNGFFSKELVLESGLLHGPQWATFGMLIGVGLTALYSTRMIARVFYGEPRGEGHAHDAPRAMRVSLSILALGTLSTWLLAGPFGRLLASSLPFHELHAASTLDVLEEIASAPATWITVAVAAAGCGLWFISRWLEPMLRALDVAWNWLGLGLTFEWLNRGISLLVQGSAALLQRTQSGSLNLNILGIVLGLLIVLAVLGWGTL